MSTRHHESCEKRNLNKYSHSQCTLSSWGLYVCTEVVICFQVVVKMLRCTYSKLLYFVKNTNVFPLEMEIQFTVNLIYFYFFPPSPLPSHHLLSLSLRYSFTSPCALLSVSVIALLFNYIFKSDLFITVERHLSNKIINSRYDW